jgi:hypothetical protein
MVRCLNSGFGRYRGEFRTADQDEADGEVTDSGDRCLADADLLAVHETEEGQRRPGQREAGRLTGLGHEQAAKQ